ncbi:MAG: HYR domain-containing protein [Saprospiraceae bacterium]|nr:HYR domain-containing protein [Saprospiraceae bacterium]MDW8229353.1 HYR domain-containing protein [Saprospiraceae bacterium]
MKRSTALLLIAAAFGVLSAVAQQPQAALTNADQSFLLKVNNVDAGHAVCPAPDGNVYVVGSQGAEIVILKVSPQGEVLSADYLGVGNGSTVYPMSAITDSEGKIAIMGRILFPFNSRSFILRYDPVLRTTLWARISEQNFFSSGAIIDLPAENAYVVAFSAFSVEIVKISRLNGVIVPGSAFGYRLDSLTVPKRMALHQGDVYVVGYHLEKSSPTQYKGRMPFMMRASLNSGFVSWAKGSPLPLQSGAFGNLESKDVVVENGAVYSVFSGAIDGEGRVYLQKRDLNGNLLWLRRLNLPLTSTTAKNLISVPDGFVLFSYVTDIVIAKLNKEGEVQWAYQTDFSFAGDFLESHYQAIVHDGALYITGKMFHYSLIASMFVLKIDLAHNITQTCDWLVEISANSTLVADGGPRNPQLIVPGDPLFILNWPVSPPVKFIPQTTLLCGPVSPCADLTFSVNGAVCNAGSPALSYTVCNKGTAEIGGDVSVWFYPKNPTQANTTASGSATLTLNPPLAPGECRSGQLTGLNWLNPNQSQTVFSLINYDNSLPTPFALSALPTTNIEECDYTNNLSSAQLTWPSAPVLNLGPDLILCEKNTVTLDAGPNFVRYEWQDGSTNRTFTAAEPGLYYWVDATDACGRTQRDSVFFSFSLLPDTRFGDTVICPGQAVRYAAPGFNTYQWSPAAGLNCTTCPEVIARPSVPTTYTLLATDSLGCTLRDTFAIDFHASQPVLQCPPNVSVSTAPGATTAVVNYAPPAASTSCPCGPAAWALAQGLPSGAAFPVGLTTVCLSAEDGCLGQTSCCFTVRVTATPAEDQPCEVKETPCVRFEILRITRNAVSDKTYRMRVINKCAAELVSVSYQLPQGIVAKAPANGDTYTAPSGRQYSVRNPQLAPQRSIRFSSMGPGIASGAADIFEYTLPPQANPQYIYALARLAPNTYVETHLNVFGCPVQQIQTLLDGNEADERHRDAALPASRAASLTVFPNPATDRLQVDATAFAPGLMRIWVTDALGRLLWDDANASSGALYVLPLPAQWPSGVYHLTAFLPDGQRLTTRFAK